MAKLRLALIGWGAIGRRVADLLAERRSPVEIAAVAVRDAGARREGFPPGAALLTEPGDLAGFGPGLVVEAAGRDAVEPWGLAALRAAPAFAVASTSAFADGAVLGRLVATAEEHGSQLLVPSGAVGGIDALAAAALLPLEAVTHTITKPPAAWRGTEAERLTDLDGLHEATTFYTGPAREAAQRFPQNANAAIVVALAGIGLDRTRVALVADPACARNSHAVAVSGGFGRFEIALENVPLQSNPRSSELTALSLVRLIENRAKPLCL